ncbi:histidine phosphatase family protein [Sneathiella marina]|uniref:Histidine phosphatase family protein n=1 Tax=Sneathiella marina TaxID=2950108 RepID=A0ABY4W2K2_9PROT|nr:histidine phosphatase family protein [Sneathiella marina]USG61177.1 histidine phosphatase family protein [Sneathiella marina]
MKRILFIRHGKTQWNLEKKLQGRRDIPLCEDGIRHLKKCAIPNEFKDYAWSVSPLGRTRETAQLLGARLIRQEPALIEMDWGKWEGRTISELRQLYGSDMAEIEARGCHMTPPGGESPAMVVARLKPWLKNLEGDTIAVTHKGVIRAAQSLAYDWDMTEELPVEFNWSAGHLFTLEETGVIRPERININLESK